MAYATVLNYFIAELLTRPLVEDIAAVLPEDFPFATNGLLIRKRLKILLPIFTGFVGLVVAALMTGDGGTRTLALSVVAAVGVGLVFSYELTVAAVALGHRARSPRCASASGASARATTTRACRW